MAGNFGAIRVSNGRRGSDNGVTEETGQFGLTEFVAQWRALVIQQPFLLTDGRESQNRILEGWPGMEAGG